MKAIRRKSERKTQSECWRNQLLMTDCVSSNHPRPCQPRLSRKYSLIASHICKQHKYGNFRVKILPWEHDYLRSLMCLIYRQTYCYHFRDIGELSAEMWTPFRDTVISSGTNSFLKLISNLFFMAHKYNLDWTKFRKPFTYVKAVDMMQLIFKLRAWTQLIQLLIYFPFNR